MNDTPKRLVLGISGASGMIYAVRFIRALPPDYQVHLIFSEMARKVMKMETGWDSKRHTFFEYMKKTGGGEHKAAQVVEHGPMDHFAPVASGSFPVSGMAIVPCSMKTLAGIANGYAETLMERAADVNLKERRPVVLVTREAPYNRIHLSNMLAAHDAGATILPASPAFYNNPQTIDELADFIIARAFNLLGIPQDLQKPWGAKRDG